MPEMPVPTTATLSLLAGLWEGEVMSGLGLEATERGPRWTGLGRYGLWRRPDHRVWRLRWGGDPTVTGARISHHGRSRSAIFDTACAAPPAAGPAARSSASAATHAACAIDRAPRSQPGQRAR